MGLPSRVDTLRSAWIRARCSSWVPWLKLSRATSSPDQSSCSRRSSLSQAGPMVQTILVRRRSIPMAMGYRLHPSLQIVFTFSTQPLPQVPCVSQHDGSSLQIRVTQLSPRDEG
jgi:hypothetical protein